MIPIPTPDFREIVSKCSVESLTNFGNIAPEDRIRKFSWPTDIMKKIRQYDAIVICVECKNLKTVETTMVCAKCKIAAYCSKSCQKLNWVTHKKECREPSSPVTFKLLHTFLCDPFVGYFLPQALIAAVGYNRSFTFNDIFIVRCELSIEPPAETVIDLATGDSKVSDYPAGVDGILQVRRMHVLDPCIVMDSAREKIWKDAKEKAFLPWKNFNVSTNGSGRVVAAGLVDFHMEGTDQVIMMPLAIQQLGLQMATTLCQSFNPEDVERLTEPGSASLAERFICVMLNNHIQDDIKNQLRLKVHLPQEALQKYVGTDLDRYILQDVPQYPPPVKFAKFFEALYPGRFT